MIRFLFIFMLFEGDRFAAPPLAIAVLTVSDHLVSQEETSADERERTFGDMVEIALEAAFA